ncbi:MULTISPECIES: hypothetical protein [Catenuloplanes]|uniref:Membrane protein n=1 Tax=Catenuloplanes niger TaxID=587534 RepID=A0AAE4CP72_9ACTN|nr:hypothetical protein [Catenuloplanes niger]MDR7320321.1 putative membrane protein [Catenuloplanes niger]
MFSIHRALATFGAFPEVEVPSPDRGGAAPADLAAMVTTAMNLIAWAGTAAGVVGVLITGTMMAISHQRGESSEHMSRLGLVLGGCILVATAGPIVGFFFNAPGA